MLASLAPELDADRIIGHVCMLCEEALGYRPYALITCASSLRSWCRPARPPTAPSRGAPRPTTHPPGQLSSDHPPRQQGRPRRIDHSRAPPLALVMVGLTPPT